MQTLPHSRYATTSKLPRRSVISIYGNQQQQPIDIEPGALLSDPVILRHAFAPRQSPLQTHDLASSFSNSNSQQTETKSRSIGKGCPVQSSDFVDRINSPGKLRAFFNEVKRSRSEGGDSAVSVPQRYRDMLNEERIKRSNSMKPSPIFSSGGGGADTKAPGSGPSVIPPGLRASTLPGRNRRHTTISPRIPGRLDVNDGNTKLDDENDDLYGLMGSFSMPTSPTMTLQPRSLESSLSAAAQVKTNDTLTRTKQSVLGGNTSTFGDESVFQSPIQSPQPARQHAANTISQPSKSVEDSKRSSVIVTEDQAAAHETEELDEEARREQRLKQLKDQQLKNLQRKQSLKKKPEEDAHNSSSRTDDEVKESAPSAPSSQKVVPPRKPVAAPIKKAEPVKKEPQKDEEAEEEEEELPEGMAKCEYCKRKFASDRVERHENACSSNPSKKERKVFNGTAIRTKGTEFEQSARKAVSGNPAKSGNRPAPKKNDWRKQHEDFINAIRSAKQ